MEKNPVFSLTHISLIFLFASVPTLAADALSEAMDERERASSDFYNQVRKMDNATPEKITESWSQTVLPANEKVNRAVNNNLKSTIAERRGTVLTVPPGTEKYKKYVGKTSKKAQRSSGKRKPATQETESTYKRAGSTPYPTTGGTKKEEAIDGNQFPKQLDFSGDKAPGSNIRLPSSKRRFR